MRSSAANSNEKVHEKSQLVECTILVLLALGINEEVTIKAREETKRQIDEPN